MLTKINEIIPDQNFKKLTIKLYVRVHHENHNFINTVKNIFYIIFTRKDISPIKKVKYLLKHANIRSFKVRPWKTYTVHHLI